NRRYRTRREVVESHEEQSDKHKARKRRQFPDGKYVACKRGILHTDYIHDGQSSGQCDYQSGTAGRRRKSNPEIPHVIHKQIKIRCKGGQPCQPDQPADVEANHRSKRLVGVEAWPTGAVKPAADLGKAVNDHRYEDSAYNESSETVDADRLEDLRRESEDACANHPVDRKCDQVPPAHRADQTCFCFLGCGWSSLCLHGQEDSKGESYRRMASTSIYDLIASFFDRTA